MAKVSEEGDDDALVELAGNALEVCVGRLQEEADTDIQSAQGPSIGPLQGLNTDNVNWREYLFIIYAMAARPILMISFACLSNTLLLTVLVAILSNTFATINADAAAESMFRKAVSTLEGVKGDSVFSYQLPFNLLAVVTMWPLSFVLSPRWFHKVNGMQRSMALAEPQLAHNLDPPVFMIRATSFPILLAIAIYERQKFHHSSFSDWIEKGLEKHCGSAPRRIKNAVIDSAGFDSFAGAGKDIDIVFEVEREVGDYYAGWDDDGDIEGDRINADQALTTSSSDEDDETTIKASQPIQIAESPSRPRIKPQDNLTDSPQRENSPIPLPRSKTIDTTLSHPPARQEDSVRRRRQSSPATTKVVARNSLVAEGLPPRRRRDSIVEPSPLARLFVRSPTEESGMPIGSHRHAGSLSMSLAHPSNLTPHNFNERQRQRRRSLLPTDTFSIGAKHPIIPIREGRQASFTALRDPSPTEEDVPQKDVVAKATAVENAQATAGPPGMESRLVDIEHRQKRIEELLQQLVRTAGGESTGQQSSREMRRESEISLDM
ncbi:hypothetical protein QFC19_008776 [Naganishia cerealis]|uniref:Uncharacterized protein n=1 Tax=Naganishia cerealis TaxID=610337 RepID=A0ACC2UZ57_9TREE|nr:hypothetical protein QFC19_008776 [Naganishia cerealis]